MTGPTVLGWELIECLNSTYPNDQKIKDLIVAGANLAITDDEKRTPLMIAIAQHHDTAAIELVHAGASLAATDENGFDIVTHALRAKNAAMIAYFFTETPLKDDRARMNDALCTAILRGLDEITSILVDLGADGGKTAARDALDATETALRRALTAVDRETSAKIQTTVQEFRDASRRNERDLRQGMPTDEKVTAAPRIRIRKKSP
jgi:ankyrin repeat protein